MGKVIVIAEAGVNHNGDLKLAYKMADEAKRAGADIVKFQTGIPEKVISKYARKAEYQKAATGAEESQLEMVKKLMLKYDAFVLLNEYCEKIGIRFLSTPFDVDSVDFLERLENTVRRNYKSAVSVKSSSYRKAGYHVYRNEYTGRDRGCA